MKEFEFYLHGNKYDTARHGAFHFYWLNNGISYRTDNITCKNNESFDSIIEKLKNTFFFDNTHLEINTITNEIHLYCKNHTYIIEIKYLKDNLKVYFCAQEDVFRNVEDKIFKNFTMEKSVELSWCYLSRGDIHQQTIKLEEKNQPLIEMYPSLLQKGISLTDYYEAFANSDAKILLLMGQRGTGKTSFLRGMLHHNKWNPIISYDEALLSNDQMLIKFLLSDSNCFIIEDADTFIYKREQGNSVIHKFLNLGDGLITKSDKKLILTTNIISTDDIDSALIRPGRCFDVLHFDTLTPEQAKTLINTKGMNIPQPDKNVSIAELFNQQPIFSGNTLKKRVGFL